MAAKLILVTGGARSGKSRFAEEYAEAVAMTAGGLQPCSLAYIATAQAWDEEMRFRIGRHQARRGAAWQTYEAPAEQEAAAALHQAGERQQAILFDCVTLYLSNILCNCTEGEIKDEQGLYVRVQKAVQGLIEAACSAAQARAVIFVTNEVGGGIVPENVLARRYRDLAGLANEQLAAAAAAVYLCVCGQAVNVKALAQTAAQSVQADLGDF